MKTMSPFGPYLAPGLILRVVVGGTQVAAAVALQIIAVLALLGISPALVNTSQKDPHR